MNASATSQSQPVAFEDKPPAYEDVVTQQPSPTLKFGLQTSEKPPPYLSASGSGLAGAGGTEIPEACIPSLNNENVQTQGEARQEGRKQQDCCSCHSCATDTLFWYLSCRCLLDCCVCFCNGLANCLDSFYDGCGNCCDCSCGCYDSEVSGGNVNVVTVGGNTGVMSRTVATDELGSNNGESDIGTIDADISNAGNDIGESDIGTIDGDISNCNSDIGDMSVSDCDCSCFD